MCNKNTKNDILKTIFYFQKGIAYSQLLDNRVQNCRYKTANLPGQNPLKPSGWLVSKLFGL